MTDEETEELLKGVVVASDGTIDYRALISKILSN